MSDVQGLPQADERLTDLASYFEDLVAAADASIDMIGGLLDKAEAERKSRTVLDLERELAYAKGRRAAYRDAARKLNRIVHSSGG